MVRGSDSGFLDVKVLQQGGSFGGPPVEGKSGVLIPFLANSRKRRRGFGRWRTRSFERRHHLCFEQLGPRKMLVLLSVRVSACRVLYAACISLSVLAAGPRAEEQSSSRKEFLQRRTDDSLSQVLHFQVVIPELVDQRGDFLSYDVSQSGALRQRSHAHGRPPRAGRAKRMAGSSGNVFLDGADQLGRSKVFYKLRAYGREYHFNLTLNTNLLSNNFVVEYWGHNGSVHRSRESWDCHYTGFSMEPVHSNAALSNCVGLYGVFSTDIDDYFVEPLWNHTNVVGVEGHPHLVYPRSAVKVGDFRSFCGVSDLQRKKYEWLKQKSPKIFNEVLKPNRRQHTWSSARKVKRKVEASRRHRHRRSISTEKHVETLVVIDKKLIEYHRQHSDIHQADGLTAYVLTIMNIVAKLYQDPSIGNAISIVVTRLIFLTGDDGENLPQISHHADKSLDSFCRWQEQLNKQSDLSRHDNAVLLTRYDICTYKNEPCGTLGLAPVEGMCESGRSCNINEDIGLASAFIIAHEIGHNFGMHHDGAGNTCGLPGHEPARIMAARLTKDTSPFQWSSCSQRYVTDFLDAGRGWCLDNVPLKREAYPKGLPGDKFDVDVQCQQQYFPLSRACKLKKACRELWCVNSAGECTTNSVPAAEGTECYMSRHKKGWCFQGDCRNPQYEPHTVDGSWGQWGPWRECSRTCGGGVEASERHCDDPKPQDGGRYCVGQRKRYRSCHVTPCAPDARDFREVQCSSYDKVPFRGHYYKWTPYTGEQAKPCALVCMAEGYNFYTERVSKVIDGTRCYPDKPHICINGECKFVGCDGYLGSRKKEDVCRVCDGDNSTCRTVSGMFDKPLPNGAYQEVVTIPRGAVYVQISEASFSTNYLALKDVKDKYYINGDWTIDWPRKFPVAGTVFHYKLSDNEPESLQALGPTSEDLVVMMLLQEENRGIQYQYNLPVNASATPHDISLYTWHHSPWSPCTKSCSTGLSSSKAECVNKSDGRTLNETFCHPQPRPRDHHKHCNQHPCPPEWSVGDWLECTRTCGEGVRTRRVECMQVGGDGDRVVQDETECDVSGKPPTQEDCHLQSCPPIWHTFEWSECAPSCGPGERTRRVVCMTSDSDSYLDERECEETGESKPASRLSCISRRCPPPQWRKGDWGQCSVSCGTGTQERSVQCQSFSGDPCDPALRPPAVRECQSMCREEEEVESNCEDKFKVAYCPLVFNFGYCERPYFQTMCCQTCARNSSPRPLAAAFTRRG